MSGIFEISEIVLAAEGEPRMSATLLAEKLGIKSKHSMTELVERNVESLVSFGTILRTVRNMPLGKGGPATKDYLE